MSIDQGAHALVIPEPHRLDRRLRWLAAIAAGFLAIAWGAFTVYRHAQCQPGSSPALSTVEVDQGDVALVVTSNGILESSVDDVVRCRVESFMGLPVAAPRAGIEPRPAQSRPARPAPASSSSRDSALAAVTRAMAVASSKLNGTSAVSKSGTASARPAASLAGSPNGDGTTAAASSSSADSGPSISLTRPAIRSFSYVVETYTPFRATLPDQGVMPTRAPPAPEIISILPEGSRVKAGDVVCTLDSSALREALAVQQLRFVQAHAWVEQAKHTLEAEKIALREYQDGVLPQDIELVRQNIGICQMEQERAARNLAWARKALAKGFRTVSQVEADAAQLGQTEIALRDAQGMLERLVRFTGKRILKSRNARIQAIFADMLSLEASYRLERERLKRIEAMIANCIMRAPRDGIVVYADQSGGSGLVDGQIREGLPVRPSQPIFRLLDPHHIQARANINESQVARIKIGQPVLIRLEAFPDRPLRGSVAEIVPIPSLADRLYSDVRTFFATVRIESGGFDALTTGLTAELEFLVESKRRVTRVPLEAVRWVGDRSFAATLDPATDGQDWQWRPIELGVTNTSFAEVVSGLEPGDRVVAHSETLPPTDLDVPPDREQTFDLALQGKPSAK